MARLRRACRGAPCQGWSRLVGWPSAVLAETAQLSAFGEVMAMRGYLLVLDVDLLVSVVWPTARG